MRTDAGIHVEDFNTPFAGKDTAAMLVVGIARGVGRGVGVKGEVGSRYVANGIFTEMRLKLIDYVGTAEIARRTIVYIQPDNIAGFNLRFPGMSRENFFNDG